MGRALLTAVPGPVAPVPGTTAPTRGVPATTGPGAGREGEGR